MCLAPRRRRTSSRPGTRLARWAISDRPQSCRRQGSGLRAPLATCVVQGAEWPATPRPVEAAIADRTRRNGKAIRPSHPDSGGRQSRDWMESSLVQSRLQRTSGNDAEALLPPFGRPRSGSRPAQTSLPPRFNARSTVSATDRLQNSSADAPRRPNAPPGRSTTPIREVIRAVSITTLMAAIRCSTRKRPILPVKAASGGHARLLYGRESSALHQVKLEHSEMRTALARACPLR